MADLDFLLIATQMPKKGKRVEIKPKFRVRSPSKHLMIRGGDFYAIWLEERGLWSTSEQDAIDLIDSKLDEYVNEHKNDFEDGYKVLYLWDAENGMIDAWHKFCQKQMRDSYHMLDGKIIFANDVTKVDDYASKKLKYSLEPGSTEAWDKLVGTLYSPKEKHKIEWMIGAIATGESRELQKFMVFYGAGGTGKSTVLKIIKQMFDGYTGTFNAKALGSANSSFALEPFKNNPLVAIEDDSDLSHIEDNTRLNSLVSHEALTVNEKFKGLYSSAFRCVLMMGTNRPVKITDAKSGLIRRLIDVSPTGETLPRKEYDKLRNKINFELGAIVDKCVKLFNDDPNYYDDYIPLSMLGASNDFYNFVMDSWAVFKKHDETTLTTAWAMYKSYCDDARVAYPYSRMRFQEELKNYFKEYFERTTMPDGTRVRNLYRGFRSDKFDENKVANPYEETDAGLDLKIQKSILDDICADCPAQYADEEGKPYIRWDSVKTTLKDLDTSKVHYVRIPENHIVIDFDIPDENGEKSFEANRIEAEKWPDTYAEVSKSGKGIHLHYIYNGDVNELSSRMPDNKHVEIKVFTGKQSLRRRLTKCNNRQIALLNGGLPLKEVKKTVNGDTVKTEKSLRQQIIRNLNKEIHQDTSSSVNFIFKILSDAYESGLSYDVSDMRGAITEFAASSSNQADRCVKLVGKMKFMSEDRVPVPDEVEKPIVIFDVEVYPNLFLICWKRLGKEWPVVRMFNPTPIEVENLVYSYRLVGFNCRRYDNHIIYARMQGYTTEQLFKLSRQIISEKNKRANCFIREAYSVSYTDIYDFASAGNKQSLKKYEIQLKLPHKEMSADWNKPIPEKYWKEVGDYCENDVRATEATFEYLKADWTARQILADIADMTVNDTTNELTTRIIFQRIRKPQSEFQYRNLAEPVKELTDEVMQFLVDADPEMMEYWAKDYEEV